MSFLPSFMIITDPLDTSLPVPEVVGIAKRGAVSFIFSIPPSLIEYSSIVPPFLTKTATALPRSMLDPPPRPIIPSHPSVLYFSKASSTAS